MNTLNKQLIVYVSLILALMAIFAVGFLPLHTHADASTSPVVSIGVGNGNIPVNNSPVSGLSYHGNIPVYATVTDDDLENYHFRIIKDGGAEGFTCTGTSTLFSIENQGYASTTLGKNACGYVYNQSQFASSTGFTNSLIATVNSNDLAAFGGEGSYWFIIGARDVAGNRTNANYLNDPRVKVIIDNTAPVTTITAPIAGATSTAPITISGTSTDANGVASTTLSFASFDGTVCSTYSTITTLTGSNLSTSSWSYVWTPSINGSFCIKAASSDVAGNIESSSSAPFVTNLSFTGATTTPNPTPSPTPTVVAPTPTPTVVTGFFSGGNYPGIAALLAPQAGQNQTGNTGNTAGNGSTGSTNTSTGTSNTSKGSSVTGTVSHSSSNSSGLETINPSVTPSSTPTPTATDIASNSSSSNSLAAATVLSGIHFSWWWVVIALVLALIVVLIVRNRNRRA